MKQEFVKTAIEYEEDSFLHRKDSFLTKTCPSPTEFEFGSFIQPRTTFQNRKPISFLKTRLVEDEDSQEESDLLREFKKYMKKDDQ